MLAETDCPWGMSQWRHPGSIWTVSPPGHPQTPQGTSMLHARDQLSPRPALQTCAEFCLGWLFCVTPGCSMGNPITFQTAWWGAPGLLSCGCLCVVFFAVTRVGEKTGGSSKRRWKERLNQFCEASCLNYRYSMPAGHIWTVRDITRASGLYRSWGVQLLKPNYLVTFGTPVSFWHNKAPSPSSVPKVRLEGAILTPANFCSPIPSHPIQLSPIALLFLLHLLSASLRGDPSLIREASPPECRMSRMVGRFSYSDN